MTSGLLLGIVVAMGGGVALGWWLGRLGEGDRRRATEVYYEERLKVCERARGRARVEADELDQRLRAYEGDSATAAVERMRAQQLARNAAGNGVSTRTKPQHVREAVPAPPLATPAVTNGVPERSLASAAKQRRTRARGSRSRVAPERSNGNGHHRDGPSWLLGSADGDPDDLKAIRGLGPVLERGLNELGVFHFRQLAQMTAEDAAWLAPRLKVFPGRLLRDDWATQAREIDQRRSKHPGQIR
jgi:predicted flap endonuclease-1-like 5' DNA nuclease